MSGKWPNLRTPVTDLQCSGRCKKLWDELIKQGFEKIWLVQTRRGHNAWRTTDRVFGNRTKAKSTAMSLATAKGNDSRIIRWIAAKRRAKQQDIWWKRHERRTGAKSRTTQD